MDALMPVIPLTAVKQEEITIKDEVVEEEDDIAEEPIEREEAEKEEDDDDDEEEEVGLSPGTVLKGTSSADSDISEKEEDNYDDYCDDDSEGDGEQVTNTTTSKTGDKKSLQCGGYPVGNIILVEEDEFGFYAKLFIKYFISEGLVSRHSAYLCSLDTNTRRLASPSSSARVAGFMGVMGGWSPASWPLRGRFTPPAASTARTSVPQSGDDCCCSSTWLRKESMTSILFTRIQSSPTPLANNMCKNNVDSSSNAEDHYSRVLSEVRARAGSASHASACMQSVRRTVLRAAVHRLGSPLWGGAGSHLTRFLYRLRHLVHNSLTTCLDHPGLLHRCEHLADCVISLESLARNCNPCFSDFNGLLHVKKFSTTNTLVPHVPEEVDWAFKLRKRRFAIVKLHLPPELADTEQRGEHDDYAAPGTCGTGGGRHWVG
ncbi:hypothetical protein LSTR_LSTR003050 [Laodelphax striatellus]|uniref:Elongator complex protein 4 n=1 Tax=Laodelphax striatellus TaxID=195883 RepID=A0A482XTK4_LAOST|nr:hypothetical protein LSTR_LSTR003050 [Laodelphax striatellus]